MEQAERAIGAHKCAAVQAPRSSLAVPHTRSLPAAMQAAMRTQRPFSAARPVSRVPAVRCQALSPASIVKSLEQDQKKDTLKGIQIGDTVKLGVRVVEGNGRTRTQTLEGIIIAEHGAGAWLPHLLAGPLRGRQCARRPCTARGHWPTGWRAL